MSLSPSCNVCGSSKAFVRCAGCKVILYCSQKHQDLDKRGHWATCNAVQESSRCMEQQLRKRSTANHSQVNLLLSTVRLTVQFKYVKVMLGADSFDALTSAAAVARNMLYTYQIDQCDVRLLLPTLCLRLGRDQEAYSFVNWCILGSRRTEHNWTDFRQPYPDIVDADAFGCPPATTGTDDDLLNLSSMALLKLRLLLDIQALQQTQSFSRKLPQELVDMVKEYLPDTDVVRNDRKIIRCTQYISIIRDLSHQVDEVIQAVTQVNPDFWPTLICHARVKVHKETLVFSEEPIWRMLYYCADAWRENPRATDVTKAGCGPWLDG
ncbi:MAG: hypothetical protein Q9209_001053 [Squamulea sp. 1 TL-2023]